MGEVTQLNVNGLSADGAGSEQNATPNAEGTQTANANIAPAPEKSETPAAPETPAWQGDLRYFQSGKKQGQLKPSAAVSGLDAEKSSASTDFGKLNIDALKVSPNGAAKKAEADEQAKVKKTKAEKKLIEAKTGSMMVMRLLDMVVDYISKGQYGRDFTVEQAKARNEYRAALQKDWEDYLLTLDIPMHPGLIVAFGSITYASAAFSTEAGQARVVSWKEKIGAKIGGWIFSRGGKK